MFFRVLWVLHIILLAIFFLVFCLELISRFGYVSTRSLSEISASRCKTGCFPTHKEITFSYPHCVLSSQTEAVLKTLVVCFYITTP